MHYLITISILAVSAQYKASYPRDVPYQCYSPLNLPSIDYRSLPVDVNMSFVGEEEEEEEGDEHQSGSADPDLLIKVRSRAPLGALRVRGVYLMPADAIDVPSRPLSEKDGSRMEVEPLVLRDPLRETIDRYPDNGRDLRLICDSGRVYDRCFGPRLPMCNGYCARQCNIVCGSLIGDFESMSNCLKKAHLEHCGYRFTETIVAEVSTFCRKEITMPTTPSSEVSLDQAAHTVYTFTFRTDMLETINLKRITRAILRFTLDRKFNYKGGLGNFIIRTIEPIDAQSCTLPQSVHDEIYDTSLGTSQMTIGNVPNTYFLRYVTLTGPFHIEIDVTEWIKDSILHENPPLSLIIHWPSIQPQFAKNHRPDIRFQIESSKDQFLSTEGFHIPFQ